MDVVLFAFCPSAAPYLEAFAAAGARPRLVVTGASSSAAHALSPACERVGAALERTQDVNAAPLVAKLRSMSPELVVVAGCPQRLGAPLRATARVGAVNCHPSLLPHYRGREPLFWAIVRGERRVGITIHHLTDELDGGPILLQRALEVPEGATSASLARDVDRLGASLVPELCAMARSGALPEGRAQLGAGSSFPPLRPEHGLLDWARTPGEIERLVRACEGELHAYTFFQGMKLVVLDARLSSETQGEPAGTVLAVDERGLHVAAAGGSVALRRFWFAFRVHDAGELAERLGIAAGSRLTHSPAF